MIRVLLLAIVTVCLTACDKSCEDRGGKDVVIGNYTYFMTIMVGNIPILTPITDNVYQCQDTNGKQLK